MKKVLLNIAVIGLLFTQSCKNGKTDFDPTGKWVASKTDFSTDIKCEKCTEEQKAEFSKLMNEGVKANFEVLEKQSYLEMKDDEFTGNLYGKVINGEYKVTDNGNKVELDMKDGLRDENLSVQKDVNGNRTLHIKVSADEFSDTAIKQEVPGVGEIEFNITKLEVTLLPEAIK